MKAIFTIAALLIAVLCRANVIDSLKTDDDVRIFLRRTILSDKSIDPLASDKPKFNEKLAKTKFIKIDLNGDGLTDLLVNGFVLFAVIDAGNGHYHVYQVDRGSFDAMKYALVNINTDRQPRIIVRRFEGFGHQIGDTILHYDTLVVRYNGFVEANNYPAVKSIKEISLSTSGCFGECPIFELAVDTDGTAVYNAIEYNDRKGKMQCEIDKPTVDSLFSLANYIQPKLLKDSYKVNWTDDQTATLTIKFNDGSVKTIADYGMIGTFGLERLYNTISRLRKTQKWELQ